MEILHYVCLFRTLLRRTRLISSQFTERTPGSFIEEREASLVWRFWSGDVEEVNADRQWARRQAAEAQNHIFDS